MKTSLFLLTGVALLWLCSCTGSRSDTDSGVIFVDVDVNQQSPLTDFISSERHVCLETNDSCMLSAGGFYGFAGDSIVIEYCSNIYLFSPTGKYISSFNHHGQGPGEYTGVYGMRVYGGEVYVWDSDIRKIFKYSLDGRLLNEINLEYNFEGFDVMSKDRIVLASGFASYSMAQFVIIDSNSGETISKICPYDRAQTISFWDYTPFAGRKDDKIFANIPFSHCTYRLDGYNLDSIASYQFNTEIQLPKCDLNDIDLVEFSDKSRNENVVRNLRYFYPAKNCYYLTFMLFGKYGYINHLLKFDKQGNVLAQRVLSGDDDKFPYFYHFFIRGIDNGEIICIRNADDLISIDEELDRTYWKDQGLTDESNPVVFFYKLKES